MPDSGENPRFQLIINGKPIAIGAMDLYGVVSCCLSWVRRDPGRFDEVQQVNPALTLEEHIGKDINVSFGGLNSTTHMHVDWSWADLDVGDEPSTPIGCSAMPSAA